MQHREQLRLILALPVDREEQATRFFAGSRLHSGQQLLNVRLGQGCVGALLHGFLVSSTAASRFSSTTPNKHRSAPCLAVNPVRAAAEQLCARDQSILT